MPTPKRPADSPATPRSSKRLRAAAAAPSPSPSPSKPPKSATAAAMTASGKTVVARVTQHAARKAGAGAAVATAAVVDRHGALEHVAARAAPQPATAPLLLGAHVSAAGGVANAAANAARIGASAFALFLKSQRRWDNPPLLEAAAAAFRDACKASGHDAATQVVPHGSYLVNLAQADADKAAQARAGFVDDLRRCGTLGIGLYNFHPGATGGAPRAEALGRVADALNWAHKQDGTDNVTILLENMAGGGTALGSAFEDLGAVIANVDDKARVGVCLDTCHAFAAGYDLRTPESFAAVVDEFDRVVGLRYLRAFHVNDSKAPLGSKRDLHANIGTGFLGLRAFHCLVNDGRLRGLPMLLETPNERTNDKGKKVDDPMVWAAEIKLLRSLVGMDPDGDEFKALEQELAAKGEEERERVGGQADRKKVKDAKAQAKAPKAKAKAK